MNRNRVEDVGLYIVGAGICFAIGGIGQCITFLVLCAIYWFGKGFMKGLRNEN